MIFSVDLGEFLLAVYVGAVNIIDLAAAHVHAAIAEIAGAAADIERLVHDPNPLLAGGIFN